jgi:hypothetical protein
MMVGDARLRTLVSSAHDEKESDDFSQRKGHEPCDRTPEQSILFFLQL